MSSNMFVNKWEKIELLRLLLNEKTVLKLLFTIDERRRTGAGVQVIIARPQGKET